MRDQQLKTITYTYIYCYKKKKTHSNHKLNSQWIPEKVKEEIQKYLETNEKHDNPKSMRHSKSRFKREVYSNSRKISNKQSNPTTKTEKE